MSLLAVYEYLSYDFVMAGSKLLRAMRLDVFASNNSGACHRKDLLFF